MIKKFFHLILLGIISVLSVATLMFMFWNYSFEISTVLSDPKTGMDLLLLRIVRIGMVTFIILSFWFFINYIVNKSKQTKE
ncbi:hypothetical protein [Bacillus thuringiensis]|uniref:hypothetical protein n=1 Tax=Bacillus thuringiensis TaxID=1428 RepID=UPI000BF28A7E|nr:hypothetical protein [Bacillus thuringiensis]PFF61041.1 hypothetical protein CN358_17435 [Bacillus thuringiensis]